MKKLFHTPAMLLTAVLLTALQAGCLLSPSEQPTPDFYDLTLPEKPHTQNKFRITLFSNDTPSRVRMLRRQPGNRIVQDEYNCWVQTPEKMLQRYIMLAYPTDKHTQSSNLAELRANITAFEFDTVSSEAVLSLTYSFKKGSIRHAGAITVRKKYSSDQIADMVAAMDQAAAEAGEKLYAAAETDQHH